MLIKVYAKRIKAYTGRKMDRRGPWERYACHGGMWAAEDGFLLYSNDFDKRSSEVIEIIKDLAESVEDVEIRILDIMQNKPAVHALLDNIKTIPTVKIGKLRLEGIPDKEDIIRAMKAS